MRVDHTKPITDDRHIQLGGLGRFFRERRGSGPKAQDVSTFFRRHNLHSEFDAYRQEVEGSPQICFGRAWRKFTASLTPGD